MVSHVQRARSALRERPVSTGSRLKIAITAGIGQGRTLLSAFDAALWQSGVHDYNLIPLSSVIPPASEIVRCDRYETADHEYGHRLYLVKAEMRSAEEGAVIAAGLGWLQWGDERGVFVEHELHTRDLSPAQSEAALADEITASLADLAQRRGVPFSAEQAGMHIVSAVVGPGPTCALVLAVYQADGWSGNPAFMGRRAS